MCVPVQPVLYLLIYDHRDFKVGWIRTMTGGELDDAWSLERNWENSPVVLEPHRSFDSITGEIVSKVMP